MNFKNAITFFDTILQNGPLGTRLKYDYHINTPTEAVNNEAGKKALIEIYESDIAITQKNHLPIILNAATYRASRNYLNSDLQHTNIALLKIAHEIRDKYNNAKTPVYISAPLGSMHDAYAIDITPTANEALIYHTEQIELFKEANVDLINVVTIPSLPEATGIALAAEKSGIAYTIGFVLNNDGDLLNGTNINDAISAIDSATTQKPLGYLITCTHTSIIAKLAPHKRLLGIQPNGSNLPHDKLTKLNTPISDSPEKFAADVVELKKSLGLKIIGGCCGTTGIHLKYISKALGAGKLINSY
jgi:homocysteine S-methyltransferase